MTVDILPQANESLRSRTKEDEKRALDLQSAVVVTELIDTPTTEGSEVGTETRPDGNSSFDAEALKAKYSAEREKRLAANTAGFAQYNLIDREDPLFGKYLDDPYIQQKIVRDSVQEETEVLIIGGGYSAQLAAVRLIEKDITDIKLVEKGGDFGGTW